MPRPTLEDSVRDPGFTPSLRDADALVNLLASDDLGKLAERALMRAGPGALEVLQRRFAAAVPPLRARILRAVARFPADPRAHDTLLGALHDADPKTRRNAAIGLGHAAAEGVEQALLDAWERDPRVEMRRSIAASLGKVGSPRSLAILEGAAASEDAELARIAERARTMVQRTSSRTERGRLDAARAPERPIGVVVECRRGLEDVLAEELASVDAVVDLRTAGAGRVRGKLRGPLGAVFAARTMLSFHFPLPPESRRGDEPLADTVARAATGDEARSLLRLWTVGDVRYRIAWAQGGHRRAATWDAAGAISKREPSFVNDPTSSLWELAIDLRGDTVEASLVPRALDDARFAWRRADVPASSHPTVAAALARVAGARPNDVVWDPFVGAGSELVERALLGPVRALYGSDVDERALGVARANLAAAGLTAVLERADAVQHAPPGVTLVLTNPPMGRRAARSPGLVHTLDRFVAHAASVLSRGGRLVWLAPWPERSRRAAQEAGLTLDWARTVDMGGFDAELQRWLKP